MSKINNPVVVSCVVIFLFDIMFMIGYVASLGSGENITALGTIFCFGLSMLFTLLYFSCILVMKKVQE